MWNSAVRQRGVLLSAHEGIPLSLDTLMDAHCRLVAQWRCAAATFVSIRLTSKKQGPDSVGESCR